MITTKHYRLGAGTFNFLYDGRIINCTWSHTFKQYNFSFSGPTSERISWQNSAETFTIIAFIVNNSYFSVVQFIEGKFHINLGLGIVWCNCPEEIRVIATLGKLRVSSRWGHDQNTGIFINWQGCFGGS